MHCARSSPSTTSGTGESGKGGSGCVLGGGESEADVGVTMAPFHGVSFTFIDVTEAAVAGL